MKTVENITLKRLAIQKRDLMTLNLWREYLNILGIEEQDYDESFYFFLDENVAKKLGLITEEEYDLMSEYNSRVTLAGLKKYHWKELANTESDTGTWDITFRGPNDIEFSKFSDNDKVQSLILNEEEFVDLIDLIKRIS